MDRRTRASAAIAGRFLPVSLVFEFALIPQGIAAVTNASPFGLDLNSILRRSGGFARKLLGESKFSALHSLPLLGQRQKVVMFHIGRSGSTVLGNLLRQHHQIYWDGEILSGHHKETAGRINVDGSPFVTRWGKSAFFPNAPLKFLEQRYPIAGLRRYYGMEIKFFHLQHHGIPLGEFLEYLKTTGFTRFIVLERKNFLRKLVSSMIGLRKGAFHAAGGVAAQAESIIINPERVQIDGDCKPLLQYFDDWQSSFAELSRLTANWRKLELSYERDIESDPRSAYQKCCEHLEIYPYPPAINYARTNPFPLNKLIQNFDDVARVLSGSPYEWMLTDARETSHSAAVAAPDSGPQSKAERQ